MQSFIRALGLGFCCIGLLGTVGCDRVVREELEKSEAELARVRQQLDARSSSRTEAVQEAPRLVHLVWFTLKDGGNEQECRALVAELKKLVEIPGVQDFEVGQFQPLGDERAMSQLDMVMQMGFDSEIAYRTYQDHPIHLQLKEDIGKYLGGPPITYDYWSK